MQVTDNVEEANKINKPSSIAFKFDSFDGPLDLLLELIKDKRMDILDLDIGELSYQYLQFVNTNLNLLPIDDISSYLVMASYLTDLKSKMILPLLGQDSADVETELEIDRLRRQLYLYKQYKDVINEFRMCQHKRVEHLSKLCDDLDEYVPEEMPEAPLPVQVPIDRLVRAWQKIVFENQNNIIDKTFVISVSNINIDEIENELVEYISTNDLENIDFFAFAKKFRPGEFNIEFMCAVFFSLLSLSKSGLINLEQKVTNGPIYISKNNEVRVESDDNEVIDAVDRQKDLARLLQEELLKNGKISRENLKDMNLNLKTKAKHDEDDTDDITDEIESLNNEEDE